MADDDVQVKIGADMRDLEDASQQASATFEEALKKMDAALSDTSQNLRDFGTAGQKWRDIVTSSFQDAAAQARASMAAFQNAANSFAGFTTTGKSAADSASVFEDAMGITADRARALRQALTTTDGAFSVLGTATRDASEALAGFYSLNRAGQMELQASAINFVQGISAGISPLRMLQTEGAQVFGALVQGGALSSGAFLGIGTAAAAATAAVALFAVGLVTLAYNANESAQAVRGVHNAMILMGNGGSFNAGDTAAQISDLKKLGDISEETAGQITRSMALIPQASDATKKSLAELSIAFAQLTGAEPEKAADTIAQAFQGGAQSILAFGKNLNLFTVAQQAALDKANQTNDVYAAQAIGVEALNNRLRSYLDYQRQVSQQTAMQEAYAAAGVEAPDMPAPKLPDFSKGPSQDPAEERRQQSVEKYLEIDRQIAGVEQDILNIKQQQAAATTADQKTDTAAALQQAQQRLQALQQQAGAGKSGGVDVVAQLKTQLAQQDAETQQSLSQQLQSHIQFWNNVLQTQQLTAAQRGQVEQQVANEEKQLNQSSLRDEIAAVQAKVAATRQGSQERIQLLRQAAEMEKAAYGAGSADYLNAEAQVTAAVRQAADQQYRDKIASLDRQAAQERAGSQQRIDDLAKETALAAQTYGQESTEYQNALKKQEDAQREHQADLNRIAADAIDTQQQLDELTLADKRADYELDVSLGRLTNDQKIADLKQFATQEYNILKEAQQKRIALAAQDPTTSDAKKKQLNNQLLVMERQFNNQMNAADRAALLQKQQLYTSIVSPVTSAMGSIVQNMLSGDQTVAQSAAQAALSIANSFIQSAEDRLTNFLVTQALGDAAQQESADTQITTNAATAASGAYSSASSIPYIGWIIAPAAAAAALGAVLAFKGGLAVGTPNVPQDMMTTVHKGEIVVPATMSSAIRSGQLSLSGPGGGNGGGGSGGSSPSIGPVHFHSVSPDYDARKFLKLVNKGLRDNPSLKPK